MTNKTVSIRNKVVGIGSYLPERILHNVELAKMVDTSDEWIKERTGISQRHIAADGHYTTVRTSDQEELFCNYALSRIEKELDPSQFIRVHRSHIVNLSFVDSFQRQHDKGQLFLQGSGAIVPVSRSKIGLLEGVLSL